MGARLRAVPIYESTLEWLHYNKKQAPTKTDVANYWHDKHSTATGGAKGDGLTDAVIFFLRMADAAGVGKFVPAGKGRDSHLKVKSEALETFVSGELPPTPTPASNEAAPTDLQPPAASTKKVVEVAEKIQLNIQIHIAADTKPAAVEEIFRNMRKYLIDEPGKDGG